MKNFITINLLILSFIGSFSKAEAQEISRKKRYLVTSQYAGSIGFISFGVGLTNKKQTLHYEMLYGNVPKIVGGPTDKLTLKIFWYPISASITSKVSWKIINPGFFAAKNFGEQFPLTPSRTKYPQGYYWWAPGLRIHVGANSALTYKISKNKDKKIMTYFEVNTNDRYLTTYFSDSNRKVMSFSELWQMGIGAKLIF